MFFRRKKSGVVQDKRKKFPLQVRSKIEKKLNRSKVIDSNLLFVRGKTFFSASYRASMTVEAAFIMPLIVFLMAAFCYLMLLMGLQVKLQESLDYAGHKLAAYGYVYGQLGALAGDTEAELAMEELGLMDMLAYGLSQGYAWKLIRDYGGENWLNNHVIWRGGDGIRMGSENVMTKEDIIDLTLYYTVKLPYIPGDLVNLSLVQRCRVKAWTGFEPPKKDVGQAETAEECVYVTETGTVYHQNQNCSHLKLSILETPYYRINDLRNSGGAKFYACERCVEGNAKIEKNEEVYITKSGTAYHCDRDCSGLKRTVKEIEISEVGDRTECKRCGQDKTKEK